MTHYRRLVIVVCHESYDVIGSQMLLSTVEAATHVDHTPQDAVRMVFAALMKVSTNDCKL